MLIHLTAFSSSTQAQTGEDCGLTLSTNIPRGSEVYTSYMHDLCAYHRLCALLILQTESVHESFDKAEVELKASLKSAPDSAETWAELGNLRFRQSNIAAATECFEIAMQLETWPVCRHRLVKLRLARCYVDSGLVGCLSLIHLFL